MADLIDRKFLGYVIETIVYDCMQNAMKSFSSPGNKLLLSDFNPKYTWDFKISLTDSKSGQSRIAFIDCKLSSSKSRFFLTKNQLNDLNPNHTNNNTVNALETRTDYYVFLINYEVLPKSLKGGLKKIIRKGTKDLSGYKIEGPLIKFNELRLIKPEIRNGNVIDSSNYNGKIYKVQNELDCIDLSNAQAKDDIDELLKNIIASVKSLVLSTSSGGQWKSEIKLLESYNRIMKRRLLNEAIGAGYTGSTMVGNGASNQPYLEYKILPLTSNLSQHRDSVLSKSGLNSFEIKIGDFVTGICPYDQERHNGIIQRFFVPEGSTKREWVFILDRDSKYLLPLYPSSVRIKEEYKKIPEIGNNLFASVLREDVFMDIDWSLYDDETVDLKRLEDEMYYTAVGKTHSPKTREELIEAIKEEFANGNTDLNCIDTSEITDMYRLFSSIIDIVPNNGAKLNVSRWDVSNVEDMTSMFAGLKEFNCDLSKWDVRNVEIMDAMFCGCKKFEGKGLEKWNISNVEDMGSMFEHCTAFNQDLSKWDVSNVENMQWMFAYCTKFNQDLSGWKIKTIRGTRYMFSRCTKLKENGLIPDWYKLK